MSYYPGKRDKTCHILDLVMIKIRNNFKLIHETFHFQIPFTIRVIINIIMGSFKVLDSGIQNFRLIEKYFLTTTEDSSNSNDWTKGNHAFGGYLSKMKKNLIHFWHLKEHTYVIGVHR